MYDNTHEQRRYAEKNFFLRKKKKKTQFYFALNRKWSV